MPTQSASHRSSFDNVAGEYLASRLPYPDRMMAWLSRHAASHKRGRALDLGCGPGMLSLPLCRLFRKVFSVDLSVGMLCALREASRRQIQRPLAVGACGEQLPFRPASVQMVACSQSLHWMDLPRTVAEIRRVLDPEGLLLLCWQNWMDADSTCEQVYRLGWEQVADGVPPRPAWLSEMTEVTKRLGTPAQEWSREVNGAYTPTSLSTFFQSRESVGRVAPEVRRRLARSWRDLAEDHLGSRIPYTFQVGAGLYTRAQLEGRGRAAATTD